ncbi:MAG: hypothetical protein ACJ74O_13410 [Frankiaceae bacterium]
MTDPSTPQLRPGDVLCVRTSNGLTSRLIRLGAALLDRDNTVNHVAIYTHTDRAGTPWCIEGRPGGVGWQDARKYLASPWTVDNVRQAKTDDQRRLVVKAAKAMLGVGYDWVGIAEDAATAARLIDLADLIDRLWRDKGWDGGQPPGHVVCSSLAAYAYHATGLEHPTLEVDRRTSPTAWATFCVERRFHVPLAAPAA